MRATYVLNEIDCALCAQKLQDSLAALPGVDSVRVNFLTQKLSFSAADEVFEEVTERVLQTIQRIEPDCEVLPARGNVLRG